MPRRRSAVAARHTAWSSSRKPISLPSGRTIAGACGRARACSPRKSARLVTALHYSMLIDFFLKLKSHKLPVSIKEYLTLLEAMQNNAIDPAVDDFYYLSRTALGKEKAKYNK